MISSGDNVVMIVDTNNNKITNLISVILITSVIVIKKILTLMIKNLIAPL